MGEEGEHSGVILHQDGSRVISNNVEGKVSHQTLFMPTTFEEKGEPSP